MATATSRTPKKSRAPAPAPTCGYCGGPVDAGTTYCKPCVSIAATSDRPVEALAVRRGEIPPKAGSLYMAGFGRGTVTNNASETDLDADLRAQLAVAGYSWRHARRCENGWHHVVWEENHKPLPPMLLDRLRNLVGGVLAVTDGDGLLASLLAEQPAAPAGDPLLDALLAESAPPGDQGMPEKNGGRVARTGDTDLDHNLLVLLQQRGWDWLHAEKIGGVWWHTVRLVDNPQVTQRLGINGLKNLCSLASDAPIPAAEATSATAIGLTWHNDMPALLPPGGRPAPNAGGRVPADHVFRRPPDVPERGKARLQDIVPGRYQPRRTFDEAFLQELADSIREHGVLTALKVFVAEDGKFELIAGEQRARAARLAGLDAVPVEVVEWTARQIQEVALIDNIQRADLSPVEEGAAYNRLIEELGISENELAKRLGKPRTTIQARRLIASAAPELQAALVNDEIQMRHARAIAAAAPGDPAAQQAAVASVKHKLRIGQTCGEKEAMELAEQAVLKNQKKALRTLGWKIEEPGQYSSERPWLYAASERPRQVSGAEIMAIVRDGKRPNGDAVAPTTWSAQDLAALGLRSYTVSTTACPPWIRLTTLGKSRFVSGVELPALLEEIAAEVRQLIGRFATHGWTLAQTADTYYPLLATSNAGHSIHLMHLARANGLLEEIIAGTVPASTDRRAAPAVSSTCACGKPATTWWKGHFVCTACEAAAVEAERQATAALRDGVLTAAASMLTAASDDALLVLVLAICPYHISLSFLDDGKQGYARQTDVVERLRVLARPEREAAIGRLIWQEIGHESRELLVPLLQPTNANEVGR